MIKINAKIANKPKKSSPGVTVHSLTTKMVPVTHIRKEYHIHYSAKVVNPVLNAPYNYIEHHNGDCWVRFLKKDNPNIKIPVLKDREVIEV